MRKILTILLSFLCSSMISNAQPTLRYAAPVGKGVDGTVYELYADDTTGMLYVGGSFHAVDSSISAHNIAYVTETNGVYTWHNMGSGVNGAVYAITKYNGNIYVAGSFSLAGGVPVTNVAYWDGAAWHDAGCTYGVIKDLVVFDGSLYASGHFDVCAAMMEVNFAKWDGAMWQQKFGLTGSVNTMEVMDTVLLLGGWFTYNGTQVNALKWNENIGFTPFGNNIVNEVNDFQSFKDSMIVACKETFPDNYALIAKLRYDNWDTMVFWADTVWNNTSFNTLCADKDTLTVGGFFEFSEFFSITGIPPKPHYHCGDISYLGGISHYPDFPWFHIDNTIHKMAVFKNRLYSGGAFKQGICVKASIPLAINDIQASKNTLTLYPNPVASNALLTIKSSGAVTDMKLTDISGKLILEQKLNSSVSKIQLPQLAAGIYMVEVNDSAGNKTVEKLEVR